MALALALWRDGPRVGRVWSSCAGFPPDTAFDIDPARAPSFSALVQTAADDEVMPPLLGRAAARALERWGARTQLREHPGGHRLTPAMLAELARFVGSA
jgi:predicted esterase